MTETVRDWLDCLPFSWGSDECLLFPFSIGTHGYGQFNDGTRRPALAHRYVCTKTYGAPPQEAMHAAHSCGNKTCVNPRHIRWASHSENEQDKKLHGRDNRGERSGKSKLTASEVLAIRGAQGLNADIAKQFGISRQYVSDIKGGRRWTHLI